MAEHSLLAISPVDGRYHNQTAALQEWFSEAALIRYRLSVEVAYFRALCAIPLPPLAGVNGADLKTLDTIMHNFTPDEASKVKVIEKTTNHDVKAVEYYLKDKLTSTPLEPVMEFVHFGLTSQDINNTAMPMMVRDALDGAVIPLLRRVAEKLARLADSWKDIPMLAHTHGQPASPTHLGKEIFVFADRLQPLIVALQDFRHSGKFGGATGNFNAHMVAYPGIDWVGFANQFLKERLGIERQQVTTQIDQYDTWAALFHLMIRINNVLLDLDRDMWSYISMNYFKQKVKAGEVGSSAMPHKVNPIDFENSEGNIGVANALFGFLADKLPVSRLQRDLSDSTVTRNIGVPFAHTVIAANSLLKGLEKLVINEDKISRDLNENWVVVSEAIQTILRREGVGQPYELLKDLTRGNPTVTRETLHAFIDGLDVREAIKDELKQITPSGYTGYDHIRLTQHQPES
ncbi:MAG: adenylosuccinate lyase [Bacteroidales bacterium]